METNEAFMEQFERAINEFDKSLNVFTYINEDGDLTMVREDYNGVKWETDFNEVIVAISIKDSSYMGWREV